MKSKKIFFLLILFGVFFSVLKVFALEAVWPKSPLGTALTDNSTIVDVVRYFYEWGVFIGGVAAFISLVFGGFLYLTSAGDPGRLREAKDRIFSAIVGLVLLLGIYLILNTINPELTVLRIPSFGVPTTTLAGLNPYSAKNCTSSILYDAENFGGNHIEIGPDECVDLSQYAPPLRTELTWWLIIPSQKPSVKSAKVSGNCTLRLFPEDGRPELCDEPKFLPITGEQKDIGKFGFGTAFDTAMLYSGCTEYDNEDDCRENGCNWCAGDCMAGNCLGVAYSDKDYKGKKLVIRGDIPDLSTSTINFNDIITSIKVASGTTIVLWEHVNFTGASTTITGDVANLCLISGPHTWDPLNCPVGSGPGCCNPLEAFVDPNFNDSVSSIQIITGGAMGPPPAPACPACPPFKCLPCF